MDDGGDPLSGTHDGVRRGSGLYVDVENLQTHGRQLIESLISDWPETASPPSRLTLYVQADQVDLWRLWAESRFEDLDIAVQGIQHFSGNASKNSADIAIATSAMADFVRERISNVVVFSDDSDFASLYATIRAETNQAQRRVPLLWVVTDRQKTLSPTIRRFFPSTHMHVVAVEAGHSDDLAAGNGPPEAATLPLGNSAHQRRTEMARAIVQRMPVGQFRSTECQGIIKELWPKDPMATQEGAAFGTEFKNRIWPELQRLGVKNPNPGKKPIRYEMTEEAKAAVVRL